MSKIVLMTDSASDIPVELERELGIKIICFQHAFGDTAYTSRVDFDNQKYYELLSNFDGIPSTSQVTPFEFQEIYEQEFADGCTDLIYVSINAKGSATHGNAVLAEELFYEDHPDAKETMRITVIDGKTYTCGYGFAVIEAAKKLQSGATADEVIAYITDWCNHCQVYFVPYTLKYAAKSGRINGATAFLGNALGIKPLMLIKDQAINDVGKIRGEKNIIKTVSESSVKEMKPDMPYCLVYGDNPESAEELKNVMTQKMGYAPSMLCQIGAEIAANAGPRVIGVVFYKA